MNQVKKSLVKALLILINILFVLIACGPEKTATETDREQFEQINKENVKRKVDSLNPLVGRYIGEAYIVDATTNLEKAFLCTLDISLQTNLVSDPGRNQKVEIPELEGKLAIYRGEVLDPNQERNQFVFTQSIWDEEAGNLKLYGEILSGEAKGKTNLNGIFKGEWFEGTVSTSLRPRALAFKLKRAE